MNTATTQALKASTKAQTLSGLWDKIECAVEREYLNLSNSQEGTDITVTIRGCGKKASVYRLPINKSNLIVVDNTEDGINTGIMKMHRRIKSKLHLVS